MLAQPVFNPQSNGKARQHTTIFVRAVQPQPMRLTERDGRILEAIHAFDGVLSDAQIQRLFFTGTTQMRLRTRLLFQHGYLARPDRRRRASLPAMIYWLDSKGAAYVAGLSGLQRAELRYRQQPKWAQLEHDLAVNDFRISVMQACQRSQRLALEQWIPQGEFWSHPDKVSYTDTNGKSAKRLVKPDGYFIIREGEHIFRLLLELDRATEDNPRFAREKVLPGIAYIHSQSYEKRFGHPSGRWLIVTTSERRLRNMKRQTESVAGKNAWLFYFTTYQQLTPTTILTAPIWQQGGTTAPKALFKPASGMPL